VLIGTDITIITIITMSAGKKSLFLVALLLFLVALAPRLPGLDLFLTTDEPHFIVAAGGDVLAALLQGNLHQTYWHFYPGVTLSWLNISGITGQYVFEMMSGTELPPLAEYAYGEVLSLLVAVRLPYVLLTAAFVPAMYLLARQLLPQRTALLGSLFVALDPFFLAHSRVAHGDAPTTVFMTCSALAFLVYLQRKHGQLPYLIASAVLGALAALTKTPGPFIALFIIGVTFFYYSPNYVPIRPLIIWGFVSLAVFILLWPAMWVDPFGTVRRMGVETFGKVEAGHLVYFFGQPTLDPGPWFYPYVIPFRMTPITLLGLPLCLFLYFKKIYRIKKEGQGLLWLFVITLLLFGTLSPKKQDRYLLPLFPFLDLLSAVGWIGLLGIVYDYAKSLGQFLTPGAAFLLLSFHAAPTITYYPYYLAYFNPLMGGPIRAAETTLMGWGEGMEQAAAYLNTRPNAEQLYVASTPSQTLLPYFVGIGENFYTNDVAFRADYVLLYLAQRQRLAPSPEIVRYFEAQEPEQIIFIQGLPYVQIYRHPRLILPDIPPTATPANIGLDETLRLAGYHAAWPRLTLYWHALAPLSADYTISIRARAADGRLLAQKDGWPVEGLLPTSQWQQGDYVVDTHTLELPLAAKEPPAHFELVVYNAATDTTLGPPITLPLSTAP
jgi:hypothetical protein